MCVFASLSVYDMEMVVLAAQEYTLRDLSFSNS